MATRSGVGCYEGLPDCDVARVDVRAIFIVDFREDRLQLCCLTQSGAECLGN
jgi:hypothetical protein